MRSLLLAASFPPATGGVETLLYQTTRRLTEPSLVLAPWPASAPDVQVRTVRLDLLARAMYRPLWALHPSLHYAQAFWQPALRAAAALRTQVVLAGHVYLAPLAWLLARRLALPFVVYAYGQEVWRDRPGTWLSRADRGRRGLRGGRGMGLSVLDGALRGAALRAADRVLVPGGFTAGLLADWGVSAARIVAVPYGAEPQPTTAPPCGTTLLSVARLIPRKGIDTVIRAMRHLGPSVEYRVIGSGPDRERLERLAAAEGVADRVQFLGRLDDAVLAQEYQRCAAFVLTARRTAGGDLEGYGLVYFEAAAWGRPVIAGRSGGEVDAVVDDQTGMLVDGESPTAVAQAIRSLLADSDRLQTYGAAGRARVETTHNWSRAAAVVDHTLASLQ